MSIQQEEKEEKQQQHNKQQHQQKAFHPLQHVKAKTTLRRRKEESNTHYVTVPARITMQAGYPLRGLKKTDTINIEMDVENDRLIVRRLH